MTSGFRAGEASDPKTPLSGGSPGPELESGLHSLRRCVPCRANERGQPDGNSPARPHCSSPASPPPAPAQGHIRSQGGTRG